MKPLQAIILAAGEGTRLRPLTEKVPKPLVPIANIPLLIRTIFLLRSQGVTEIGINLCYKAEQIISALGDGEGLGVSITYSQETELLGTAGGVKRFAPRLTEAFLVLYGDNLYDFTIAPLIAHHHRVQTVATIATFTTPDPTACGLVGTDSEGYVTQFLEKPLLSEVFTDQANAGVYVLEPEVLDCIPSDIACDFGRDVFPAMLGYKPLTALPLGGYLCDTGTFQNYRKANWDAMGENMLAAGRDTQIAPDVQFLGRNIIGAGTIIEPGATLTNTICWENCRIGSGATLEGIILAQGVQIAPNTHLKNDVKA
jgi:NDP-sugar pyrophosphorylase family protein